MKKIIIGMVSIVLFVVMVLCVYITDMHRMENNRPVLFSTWGMDYAPPEISPQTAVDTVLEKFDIKNIKTITNAANPQDGLLGPMVYFVDRINGDILAAEYRE